MRTTAVLLGMLVLAAALAGCASKAETDDPAPPAVSTQRPPPPQPTVTVPPPPPPPVPDPKEVHSGSIKYVASGNDADQMFNVPAGVVRLVAEVLIVVSGSGAYSVQGEGSPPAGNPAVAIQNPAEEEWRTEFAPVTAAFAASAEGQQELRDFTVTIQNPAAGAWNVGVRGTGNNVQADVVITAYFE